MPITQSRMRDLIHAARTYYEHAKLIRSFCQDLVTETGSAEAIRLLDAINADAPPPEIYGILAKEEAHFKMTWKENERNKRRMREVRAETAGERVSLQTKLRQRKKPHEPGLTRHQDYGIGAWKPDTHFPEEDAALAPSHGLEEGPTEIDWPEAAPTPEAVPGPSPGTTLDVEALATRIEKERDSLAALAGDEII